MYGEYIPLYTDEHVQTNACRCEWGGWQRMGGGREGGNYLSGRMGFFLTPPSEQFRFTNFAAVLQQFSAQS